MKKASRQEVSSLKLKAERARLMTKLVASRAEAVGHQQRAEWASRRAAETASELQDAREQLQDLANVLPADFIGAPSRRLEQRRQIRPGEIFTMQASQARMDYIVAGPGDRYEEQRLITANAVQAVVDTHYDIMADKMHARLGIGVQGIGGAQVAYVVSIPALRATDPQTLARIITREMRPRFADELAAMQRKMGSRSK